MTDFLFEYDNSTFSAFDTKIGSVVYSLISYSRSTSVRFVADAGTVDAADTVEEPEEVILEDEIEETEDSQETEE